MFSKFFAPHNISSINCMETIASFYSDHPMQVRTRTTSIESKFFFMLYIAFIDIRLGIAFVVIVTG